MNPWTQCARDFTLSTKKKWDRTLSGLRRQLRCAEKQMLADGWDGPNQAEPTAGFLPLLVLSQGRRAGGAVGLGKD